MQTDRLPTVVPMSSDGNRYAKTTDATPEAVETQQPRTDELGRNDVARRRGRL